MQKKKEKKKHFEPYTLGHLSAERTKAYDY